MRERLLLWPGEHWDGGELIGISIHVYKGKWDYVGKMCIRPMKLRRAIKIANDSLQQSGYDTQVMLDGKITTYLRIET